VEDLSLVAIFQRQFQSLQSELRANSVGEFSTEYVPGEEIHCRDRAEIHQRHDHSFWIEGYYNGERRQSTISYLSPVVYEQQFALSMDPGEPHSVLPRPWSWWLVGCSSPLWYLLLEPGPAHWDILCRLSAVVGVAANLTSGAYLAALASEPRYSLCSADGDFRRFPGLRWIKPLA